MGTNRPVIVPTELDDFGIMDALHRVEDRVQALAWMLACAMREGGGEEHADAVHSLFDQQAAMVAGIADAVSTKLEENNDLRLTLGEKTGLDVDQWSERVEQTRDKIVAERLREGADVRTIATVMNMSHPRVEAVIEKLKGSPQPRARQRAAS